MGIFGDAWRRRHDSIKQHLVSEALLAGVHTDCEVYGLFSDLLPAVLQQDGGELQWGQARLGLVPDFKFLLNTPQGPKSYLGELKCVNAGRNWFPRGDGRMKGTDRRAQLLSSEYEAKLRVYNVCFHGATPLQRGQPAPPPGPLVRRLQGYELLKLVAGP